jgi:DNA (cytosine-5)-methyltransferase 1
MTFGSLFAGIGGMDLGLERAGMECRWQVEIDPFCRKVLAKHWPNVKRYEDIRTVNWGEVERVDLIAGGFPCQPFSSAGARRGTADARWLWPEFARAVRALRPRRVLVENVPGLLAAAGGMGAVLGDLASSGYDTEWDCIPAAAVGAPHLRDRVWIVGYAHEDGEPVGAFDAEASGLSGMVADAASREGRQDGQSLSGERGSGISCETKKRRPRGSGGGGGAARAGGHWWATQPSVGRVADGVPDRMDRLRGLGNAVVPQVAEFIGRRILECA